METSSSLEATFNWYRDNGNKQFMSEKQTYCTEQGSGHLTLQNRDMEVQMPTYTSQRAQKTQRSDSLLSPHREESVFYCSAFPVFHEALPFNENPHVTTKGDDNTFFRCSLESKLFLRDERCSRKLSASPALTDGMCYRCSTSRDINRHHG